MRLAVFALPPPSSRIAPEKLALELPARRGDEFVADR
jgi:hypothetical protein